MARKIQTGTSFHLFVLLLTLIISKAALAQTTTFTYQGKLTDAGNPANGNYDLQFKLFDTVTVGTGTQQGGTLVRNPVAASAGVFTVTLDFNATVFGGADRYLEIGVRPANSAMAYTVLAPRQPITSSPYAIQTLNAQLLGGLPAGGFVQNTAAPQAEANFNIGGNGTASTFSLSGSAPPAVAPIGQGRIYFDTGTNKVKVSESGAAFVNLVGATGVSGSGTVNSIPLWSAGTTLGTSLITQSGGAVQLPNAVQLAIGAQGNQVQFGSPSGETGMSISGTSGRADVRFDSTGTLKLVTTTPGLVPPNTNGIAITSAGNVGIGTVMPGVGTSAGRLHVLSSTAELPAIYGESANRGVWGKSTTSRGVYGESTGGEGVYGTSSSNFGVAGVSTFTTGVYGQTAAAGATGAGVYGISSGTNGIGVTGEANVGNAWGVYGKSTSATGVGVYAQNPSGNALVVIGNAVQSDNKGGLVKALVYVDGGTSAIIRCYNGVTGSSTGNCGFSVDCVGLLGICHLNLGFNASQRFISITPEAAPRQSGGSYNITQSVISGGGGTSAGGSYVETGLIGQSVAGASSGGQYSVEGGFLVGGQSGGCQTILVNPQTLPNGSVGVGYPNQIFTAGGGAAPYSFTVSIGNLPTGLNLVGDTLSGTPTAAGTFNFTITATDNMGCQGFQVYAVTINNGGGGSGLQFYPLAHPVRLLDTRPGQTGCDAPGATISGGTSRRQTAAGRTCDGLTIPANAKALTGNITTVESGGGFLTLYPSDVNRPLVANSNFAANQVLNNVFTVGLGAVDGAFNIFVTTSTNVVVDITGYYAPPSVSGLYFHPLPKPVRLLDSRVGATACFTPGALLTAGSTTTQLGTTTCDGVTIPGGALALVGNATVVNPQANGFLTLFPADAMRPLAASSNFQTGINMNGPFTVGLSPSGQFNIYTAAATDLVVDVLGYYSTQLNDTNGQGLLFNSLPTPVRLLDTRAGATGCFTPGAQMTGGTPYSQPATGACTGIPAAAKAVVGNATTVNVVANGFLTFWPSDASQPNVATSNYRSGTVFNRHFTVGLGLDGAFKRYAASTTDLVIDLSGYFAP